MAIAVYIMCAVLSFACAYLLYRGYKANHFRLLFWSSLGFFGFAFNNILLIVDTITGPSIDLSVIRLIPALLGMIVMLYGLIAETV